MRTFDNIMKILHVTTQDPHLDSRNFIIIRRQRKVISYMRNIPLAPKQSLMSSHSTQLNL